MRRGDRLAGRFVVIQFLAGGGMGEVYDVADEHLQGKHCALKTLRPEIAADPVVQPRFEREVLLARDVSHPNVCPTYDIFRLDEPGGPLLFLTMKLLRGESLAARLRRSERLDSDVTLAIARQMAGALDAARDNTPGRTSRAE
jgi:serine/threonine protein kinase